MNIEKYTERARGFIQSAQSLAMRDGHQQFSTLHMLKVLLDDSEGLAGGLIDRAGGNSRAILKATEDALGKLPKVSVSYPVESNAMFARIPEPVVEAMHQRGWKFYTHVGGWEDSRLMCSWDTTPEDVDAFATDLKELVTVDK